MKYLVAIAVLLFFSSPALADEEEQNFRTIDTDRNGVIDREEAAVNPDLAHKFETTDRNADGMVTFSEFLTASVETDASPEQEEAE